MVSLGWISDGTANRCVCGFWCKNILEYDQLEDQRGSLVVGCKAVEMEICWDGLTAYLTLGAEY
jgi:hypothetical protein